MNRLTVSFFHLKQKETKRLNDHVLYIDTMRKKKCKNKCMISKLSILCLIFSNLPEEKMESEEINSVVKAFNEQKCSIYKLFMVTFSFRGFLSTTRSM